MKIPTYRKDHCYSKFMPFLANNIRYFHRPTIVKVVEKPEKKPRPMSKSPKTVLPISIPLKVHYLNSSKYLLRLDRSSSAFLNITLNR